MRTIAQVKGVLHLPGQLIHRPHELPADTSQRLFGVRCRVELMEDQAGIELPRCPVPDIRLVPHTGRVGQDRRDSLSVSDLVITLADFEKWIEPR